MAITGIILAGGKSTRMGRDKGLCPLGGKPLIAYPMELLTRCCDTVLLSTNQSDYRSLGLEIIPDEIPELGPIGGILSALRHSRTEDNLILSCDMPLIPGELIDSILEKRPGFQAVVPVVEHFLEPLCAYYSKNAVDQIEEHVKKGDLKVQHLLDGLKTYYLRVDQSLQYYIPDLFANVNDAEELKRIERILDERKSDT